MGNEDICTGSWTLNGGPVLLTKRTASTKVKGPAAWERVKTSGHLPWFLKDSSNSVTGCSPNCQSLDGIKRRDLFDFLYYLFLKIDSLYLSFGNTFKRWSLFCHCASKKKYPQKILAVFC